MAKLFDALMMLLCGHRYATPKKALHLIHTNAETRKLFSRHMQLRPNPTTIRIVDALMDLRTADKDKQRPVLLRNASTQATRLQEFPYRDNYPCEVIPVSGLVQQPNISPKSYGKT
jgi:hypothetical protein